jgi:CBS domain containing-hemolysin-like protein
MHGGCRSERYAGADPVADNGDLSINLALGLLAVCLLIVANGVFVAAEFALVAVDRSRIDRQAESGSRQARLVRALLQRLSFHLAGAQLGITVTSLVIGFLAEPVFGEILRPVMEPLVGSGPARGMAVTVGFVLATIIQMIVGELMPKGLAIAQPERTSRALAPFLRLYGAVLGPFIHALHRAANWTVRRMGMEPREELSHVRTLPELELLIAASQREGTLPGSASTLLTRSIRFGRKTAADALVPRTALRALSSEASVADLVAASAQTGHSRFPVFGADLDDIRGVVHIRAAHTVPQAERATTPVSSIMSEVLTVPESRELEDVLFDMRAARQHLAVVIDEYGGTAGIITLEDIVEEIVGEIDDEYDVRTPRFTRVRGSGEWILPGTLHRDEVSDTTGLELPDGPFDTLAGFVLDRLGHIPEVGEQLSWEGWTLTVVAMDRRRIAEVAIVGPADDSSGTPAGARPGP